MYELLDIGFFLFHSGIILFNLFGWIWEQTRPWNLALLLLTAFSWFGLGIWYGWGYCPSTHWHWLVRRELEYAEMPNSYIKFMIDTIFGTNLDAVLVDATTVILFLGALCISTYLNVKDYRDI
jgi:hypothetical protein